MATLSKTLRKRVANFSLDEKELLAQLIKKRPIVESKFTDGKTVEKKKAAWDAITKEFNDCQTHVHKRNMLNLKRAWDNMKSLSRKSRAVEHGDFCKSRDGHSLLPHPRQQGDIISMVEEAAPLMVVCEINSEFDSDSSSLAGHVPRSQELSQEPEGTNDVTRTETDGCNRDYSEIDGIGENNTNSDKHMNVQINETKVYTKNKTEQSEQYLRCHADYVRQEAVLRIKTLKAKLATQESQKRSAELEEEKYIILKRAAELEEERNKILLEKVKLELEEVKKRLEI